MLDLKPATWNPKNTSFHQVGNVKLVNGKKHEILEELRGRLSAQSKTRIFFLDLQGFNLAQQNPHYLRNLNAAEFVLTEGLGIRLAVKAFNHSLGEDLNSSQLVPEVLRIVNEKKMSVYLLGGDTGLAEEAAKNIVLGFPELKLSGIRDGNFTDPIELLNDINRVKPDLLLVGLGTPIEEGWISHYFHDLDATIIMALSRHPYFQRAAAADDPAIIRKLMTDRLLKSGEIVKRYIIDNWVFFINIMKFAKQENTSLKEADYENEDREGGSGWE